MKMLDVGEINRNAPYSVWISGTFASFRFKSDTGIMFVVDFIPDDLITSGESYQLIIGNVDNRKSPRDSKVRMTIQAIVEEFFRVNQAALLYICETGDGKQIARGKLFSYWFDASRNRLKFTMITSTLTDDDGMTNVATLIVRNDNPFIDSIIGEFTETIKLLGEKP